MSTSFDVTKTPVPVPTGQLPTSGRCRLLMRHYRAAKAGQALQAALAAANIQHISKQVVLALRDHLEGQYPTMPAAKIEQQCWEKLIRSCAVAMIVLAIGMLWLHLEGGASNTPLYLATVGLAIMAVGVWWFVAQRDYRLGKRIDWRDVSLDEYVHDVPPSAWDQAYKILEIAPAAEFRVHAIGKRTTPRAAILSVKAGNVELALEHWHYTSTQGASLSQVVLAR